MSTRRPPAILVFAQASAETDELLSELVGRADLHVLRVSSVAAASTALHDMPIALALSCPEIPVDAVTAFVAEVVRRKPGVPVLAIRDRQAPAPPSWRARGVGVLRCPLLPDVLNRSVDVALRLGSAGKG